jgi:hypothetical protein
MAEFFIVPTSPQVNYVVGATGPLLADASIPMRAICGDGVEHLSTHLRAPGQRARCKQRHALRT